MVASWRWFARTFAVAVVAHLVGNPAGWHGDEFGGSALLVVASGLLAILALLLIVSPSRLLLGTTAALVLLTLWLELPVTGNHWVVVGVVAVAVLVSLCMADPWGWFSVTGRWILLAFYSFAAFAKLNSGFLEPSVSCGVFYANQSLASFGLPTFEADGLMGAVAIAGPVMTELSVPLLLAFTRTRRAGVLVALVFHTIISLDFDQHFYDFTGALMMLLCLFLPETTTSALEARATRPSRVRLLALALVTIVLAASLMPQSLLPAVAVVRLVGFGVWVPFAVWLIVRVARDGLGPSSMPMRPPGVVAWALIFVVVANGLTPYLELKTSLSFNMYANLRTVAGESNHLVVRRTLHLSDAQDDLVEVVETDDPGLTWYSTEGYLLPERNLLDYLARHPDVSVVVRDGDGERTLDGSDGVRTPLLMAKFVNFRAVDEKSQPRCQAVWLPAL
jgi:hypothetical protein